MEREALQMCLEYIETNAHERKHVRHAIKEALAQPAQKQWNAALDEAAARIGEIKGFGQATQDSFAVYIKGLKK